MYLLRRINLQLLLTTSNCIVKTKAAPSCVAVDVNVVRRDRIRFSSNLKDKIV